MQSNNAEACYYGLCILWNNKSMETVKKKHSAVSVFTIHNIFYKTTPHRNSSDLMFHGSNTDLMIKKHLKMFQLSVY